MMDRRGVHRGKCLVDNCECSQYELPPDPDSHLCSYCGDPPAKHSTHVSNTITESNDEQPEVNICKYFR